MLLSIEESMPSKYSYLYQCVEMMCLFKVFMGYFNDQSMEDFKKLTMNVMSSYESIGKS